MSPRHNPRKTLGVRIDERIRIKLEGISKQKGIPISEVARAILSDSVDAGLELLVCRQNYEKLSKQYADLKAAANIMGRALASWIPLESWVKADQGGLDWSDAIFTFATSIPEPDKDKITKLLTEVGSVKPGSCVEHWVAAAMSYKRGIKPDPRPLREVVRQGVLQA